MYEIIPWFFILARTIPYWAIPMAIVLVDLMIYYRRKRARATYVCAGAIFMLVCLSIGWVAARGDLYADQWMKIIF